MQEVKTPEEYQEMLKENKFVILDIFAEWCGPCKTMMPVLDSLEEKYSDELTVYKLDADNANMQEIIQGFHVRSIPTFIFIKNGEVVGTEIGAQPLPKMEAKYLSSK